MALIPSGNNVEKALERRRNSEPARSFLWHVQLPDLLETPQPADAASMKEAATRWKENGNRVTDMALLNTLITDISTPFFSFETGKATSGSTFWYEAKHNDITDLTLTIEEQQNGMVYNYLKNWSDMIVNPDGTYNPPFFYKRNIKFYLLDMAKNEFQVFEYSGYFITEVSPRSHSYENTEAISYDVSFTGDSLRTVATVDGVALSDALEKTSQALDVDIPYNRFDFAGTPSSSVIAGVLNETARRVL